MKKYSFVRMTRWAVALLLCTAILFGLLTSSAAAEGETADGDGISVTFDITTIYDSDIGIYGTTGKVNDSDRITIWSEYDETTESYHWSGTVEVIPPKGGFELCGWTQVEGVPSKNFFVSDYKESIPVVFTGDENWILYPIWKKADYDNEKEIVRTVVATPSADLIFDFSVSLDKDGNSILTATFVQLGSNNSWYADELTEYAKLLENNLQNVDPSVLKDFFEEHPIPYMESYCEDMGFNPEEVTEGLKTIIEGLVTEAGQELLQEHKFTITWKDNEGNVIDTTSVKNGLVPTHETVTKKVAEADASEICSYSFLGWSDTLGGDVLTSIPAAAGAAEYYAVFAAVDHDFKSTVTEPNCTEDGYTTHTCKNCNYTYTDGATDALDHDYEAVVTEPNCTEGGYTTYTCTRCNDTYTDDATEALGHNYEADVTEPTCTEGGYTTYTCTRCNDTYTDDATEALGHDYKAVVSEPNCTEGGYTTYTCTRCNDTYVDDETEALGHDYKAVVTEPNCTEGGYTTYTCTRCNDTYVDDKTEALGHDYEAVVTEPNCTEGGYTTHTCTRCNDTYVDDKTEALGHDYEAVVTEPTCTEGGYTTYTCTRCNDTYVGDETEALGHSYGNPAWTWVGSESEGYSAATAEFSCDRTECDGAKTSEAAEVTFSEDEDHLLTYTATVTFGGNTYTDTKEVCKYLISFVNEDGTILQQDCYFIGATPSYEGETPVKEADDQYTYTFDGWTTEIAAVDGDATYTAHFTENAVPIVYTVTEDSDTTYTENSEAKVKITVKRNVDDDTCIDHYTETQIDGETVIVDAQAGSTIITIGSEILDGLEPGIHRIKVIFDDGEAIVDLTVKEAVILSPKTDDGNNIGMWVVLIVVFGIGICALKVYEQKQRGVNTL